PALGSFRGGLRGGVESAGEGLLVVVVRRRHHCDSGVLELAQVALVGVPAHQVRLVEDPRLRTGALEPVVELSGPLRGVPGAAQQCQEIGRASWGGTAEGSEDTAEGGWQSSVER